MRFLLLLPLTVTLLARAGPTTACVPDVLTQHNNNARSGANTCETRLRPAEVAARFHRLWLLPADGQIAAQPLYVSGLKTPRCPGGCNAVVFVTMNNTVYVYDADRPPSPGNGTLLWARWLGPPQPNCDDVERNIDVFFTNDPAWGILSTPVIDRAAGTIYLVAWHDEQGGVLRLHALKLEDGSDRLPARTIAAAAGTKRLDVRQQKQRAGLLLEGGVLYLGFASAREFEGAALNGWVLAYDARTLAPLAAWCATPGGSNGGVWASGQGLAADGAGNVYVATGNGTFDEAASGRRNYAGSVVRLRLEAGELGVKDFFTPCSQAVLTEQDLDLGSAGPVLFGPYLAIGGKQGRLYTMAALKLAGYRQPRAPGLDCVDGPGVLSSLRGSPGHIYGSPVYWNARVYLWGVGGRLRAFPVSGGKLAEEGAQQAGFDLASQQLYFGRKAPRDPCVHNALADAWMPGGILAVSSDGERDGIVWALVPANGDANRCRGIKGMLMAFEAGNISRELWRSQRLDADNSDGPDSFGLLARFVPPTPAGGKVFVATFGDWERRDFYHLGKRPATRYPPRPGDRPRGFHLAVYGLR
jgi:hypothetical protein